MFFRRRQDQQEEGKLHCHSITIPAGIILIIIALTSLLIVSLVRNFLP